MRQKTQAEEEEERKMLKRLADNRELGERIRAKQKAFLAANPDAIEGVTLDKEDERILDEVWDEERERLENNRPQD